MWIGKDKAIVNGKEVKLDQPPVIDKHSNRTLVPIRFVAESLGLEVKWNEKERRIDILE